ncbi:MAG: alpha/beta hydrolase [Usitatibacteraceae bacterium]
MASTRFANSQNSRISGILRSRIFPDNKGLDYKKPGRFRRLGVVATFAALGILLSACSPARLFNALSPDTGFQINRDLAYGQNPRNQLDVYTPISPNATAAGRPVVVFFYGGAWDSGEKSSYLFAAEALTSKGFVVVVPDYRLYPEVIFPAYMDDAARAVKWTFDNIAQYGGDASKVFVMGHSAGAQLAALVAYDGSYLGHIGFDKNRIRGVISLAGPLDFLPLTEAKLELIFPLSVRPASQAINFVVGKEPPTLLLHGEDDTRVGIHNSRNLAARIVQRGGEVQTTYYPDMGHVGILLAMAAPLRDGKPVLDRVAKFIEEHATRR